MAWNYCQYWISFLYWLLFLKLNIYCMELLSNKEKLHGIIAKLAMLNCMEWMSKMNCMELLSKLNCLEWMSKLNIVWSINVTVELHGIDVNRILRKRDSENLLIIPRQKKMRKYTPDMWKNSLGNFSICCAYLYEMICFCALQKCTYICIDDHHM